MNNKKQKTHGDIVLVSKSGIIRAYTFDFNEIDDSSWLDFKKSENYASL